MGFRWGGTGRVPGVERVEARRIRQSRLRQGLEQNTASDRFLSRVWTPQGFDAFRQYGHQSMGSMQSLHRAQCRMPVGCASVVLRLVMGIFCQSGWRGNLWMVWCISFSLLWRILARFSLVKDDKEIFCFHLLSSQC